MGKLKKGRRNQKGRLNPLAKKANTNASKQEIKDETLRQNKIVPLIEKLSSATANDRSMALNAITVIAEDEKMRKLLLKERLIPTVLEHTLNDTHEDLVVDSFGLLRNLTIEEGYEVAKFLWRSDIWSAIELGLTKIEKSIHFMKTEPQSVDKKTSHMLFDFIENVLSLIVSIASCSADLYDSVYSHIDRILALVLDALNWNIEKLKTTKLFNSLLDFLYEFASDSDDFINTLATTSSFNLSRLVEAVQSPSHEKNDLGKIYVQGITFHILEIKQNGAVSKEKACIEILRNTFATITIIDINNLKQLLSTTDNAQEPIQKPKPDEQPQDIDVPFGSESEEKIHARSDLQAIEISIDLFTSICEFLASGETGLAPTTLSEEISEFFLSVAIPSYLHLLVFDQGSEETLHLTPKLLVAFNNLCWLFLSTNVITNGWLAKIPELWQAVENASRSDDLEHQRLALDVLWALTKTIGPEVRHKITANDVGALLKKCEELISALSGANEPDALTLEYILSTVGFLGSVAQVIGDTAITSQISQFLVSSIAYFTSPQTGLKAPKALEIPVESLNLIYDIFGDASFEYDYPVFVQQNYLQKLRDVEPQVKTFYKQIDKNRNAELKVRAEEAWINLGRFIQYKESERSS